MKISRTRILTLIAVLAAAASSVLAQAAPKQPPDPATRAQRRVNFLTTLLSLNASQQQQATTIFTSAATSEDSLRSEMKSAREGLRTAIKSNDTAGIDRAAATIGNLTTQLTSAEAKANAAFYQILTPDQQNKLTQLESQRGGFGPGMGPRRFPKAH